MRVIFTLISLALIHNTVLAQTVFVSQPSGGSWSLGTTWDQTACAGGCVEGVDFPGPNDFAIIAVSPGNSIAFARNNSYSVKDLYIVGNVAGSIRTSGLAGVAIVTINGQISGADELIENLEPPTVDVFQPTAANINFVFTGTNLDDPSGSVITQWGHSSPFYRVTFNPGAGNIVRTDSHSIRNSSTVQSGIFQLNSGQEIRSISGATTMTSNAGTTLNVQGAINGGSTSSGIPSFTANGTLTAGPSSYINATEFVLGPGATFNCAVIGRNEGWWHDDFVAPTTTTPIDVTSTVNYSANADQSIYATTYGNINFGGTGTKTIVGTEDFIVSGNISVVTSPVTLTSVNTNEKSAAGNVTVNGTWSIANPFTLNGTGTQTIGGSGTVNFAGGLQIANIDDVVTLAKDINVTGGLTVNAGATLNLASRALTLNGGTLTYDGTITANTGGAGGTLISTGTTAVTGTASSKTLNNLSVTGGTFTAPTAGMVLTGNLNVTAGTFVAPGATLDLAGNLSTVDNTNYNANSGTLNFNGAQNQTISGTVTANDITIINTAASDGILVAGTLNLGGVLTLSANTKFDADGAAGTGSTTLLSSGDEPTVDGAIAILPSTAVFTGNVTVQRYMSLEGPEGSDDRIWRYISSPVQGASVAQIQDDIPVTGNFTGSSTCSGCTTNPSMFRYFESETGDTDDSGGNTRDDGFVQFPVSTNTQALVNGRGYALFVRGSLLSGNSEWSVTGPIHRGQTSYAPTYTSTGVPENDGWNLVGNPYPSTIDWDADVGWIRSNLSNAIYFRDEATGQPAAYVDGIGTNGASRYIATGQAFWVQANASGPVLQSEEEVKVAGTQTTFIRDETPVDVLRIALRDEEKDITDELVLVHRENSTEGFDTHADAWKWKNFGVFNLSTIASSGEELAINSIPDISCGTRVKLNIQDIATGTYKLEFSGFSSFTEGVMVKVTDKYTNKIRVMSADDAYEFSVTDDAASYGTDRMEVTFVNGEDNEDLVAVAEALDKSCGSGAVELLASGAPQDGEYYWYDSQEAANPIDGQYKGAFTTPVLDKSSTYYVAAVDSKGCIGARTPVLAEVTQFDPITINQEISGVLESNYTEDVQWYFNNEPIEGATSPILRPEENGVYRVQSLIEEGCVASAEYDFLITDLHEQDLNNRFRVYPNPSDGILQFSAPASERVNEVTLMNNLGATIGKMHLDTYEGVTSGELDLQNVAAGFYTLRVRGEKSGLVSLKIVRK